VDVPSDRPNGAIQDFDRGKVGAICQKCNWHLEVKVMWPKGKEAMDICPTATNPMHFFVITGEPTTDESGKETYLFGCNICTTLLNISYRPPRLSYQYYDMLTDADNLKIRAEEAAQKEAGRPGIEPQSGIRVLEALASYLTDALIGRSTRGIPAHNRRFMTSFGEDCIPLLEWLGFRRKGPDGEEFPDGTSTWAEHEIWELPKVTPASNHHPLKNQESSRIQLDDIVEELWAQIRRYPPGQLSTIKHQPPTMMDYEGAALRLLGASDYEKATGILRGRRPVDANNATLDDEDGYAGLGVSRDFSSNLVMHAFRKQIDWLPEHNAYFFDCVTAIKDRRATEEMQMNFALLMSEGYSSRADVMNAYRYLGFDDLKYLHRLTDNEILGRFDSRLQSIGRNQEAELRSQLKIIGRARGSAGLLSHSENEVTNEAGALRLLDPMYNGLVPVADDQVIALAVSKLYECKGNLQMEELCFKAVDVIAKERNSEVLQTWLITKGDGDNMMLDPAEIEFNNAKRYFEIAEGQTEIDLAVLQTLMAMKVQDDPSSEMDAHRHYAVIQERLRLMEEHRLQGGHMRGFAPDYTMPVGLSNMGNTCYLNSYLQFFYAVKPLRDLILDFGKYRIDIDDPKLAPRKVDGLTIGKADIMETQKCKYYLNSL
jgi:ubiquitin carboxyl-terminal hydrolase 25/28